MRPGSESSPAARLRSLSLLLSLTLAGAEAHAAGASGGAVEGVVRVTAKGAPVADGSDVIVYVVGFTEPPPKTAASIKQEAVRFSPTVLPVTVGQEVSFPNLDMAIHNVFAPNPADERPLFDLGQYGDGEVRKRRFEKPGAIDLFCNIHPEMAATILVLPNRRFARTDAAGRFRIEGVPAGTWDVFAFDRAAAAPTRAKVTVTDGGTATLELAVARTRTAVVHKDKHGNDYGTRGGAYAGEAKGGRR